MSNPSTPGRRAHRFHRPLTDAELAAVLASCRDGGVTTGMPALWDVILGEAEGVTWDEATEQGQRYEPGRYAIPAQQADAVRKALQQHSAGVRNAAYAVAMAWLDIGPATY